MDGGIIVVFADGVTSLFEASFLYEQVNKRIKTREEPTGHGRGTKPKQAQKSADPIDPGSARFMFFSLMMTASADIAQVLP